MTTLITRLALHPTSVLCDALDALRYRPGVLPSLAFWCGGSRISGRIVAASLVPYREQRTKTHLASRAIASATPGEVLLIDNAGHVDAACWGGLLSLAAQRAGLSGAVVNGATRDVDEIDRLRFPVVAIGSSALSARRRYVELESERTVSIDGVSISTGDYIVADRTATVIIPQDIAEEVAHSAGRVSDAEAAWSKRLANGESPAAVLNSRYETMLEQAADR